MADTLERPKERPCVECDNGSMRLVHGGQYSAVYVCPACGVMLSLPPTAPEAPVKKPDPQ